MNQAYTEAVKEHTQEHIESLLELNKVLATRSLSFLERSAAERSVQVVVEPVSAFPSTYVKKLKNRFSAMLICARKKHCLSCPSSQSNLKL